MHISHITNLIRKIIHDGGNRTELQNLVDLATLGYRDGLLRAQVDRLVEEEGLDPLEADVGDIYPEDMERIIDETENYFQSLMTLCEHYVTESKKTSKPDPDLVKLIENVLTGHKVMVDLTKFKLSPPKKSHTNRVKVTLDELSQEFPGLFE